MTVTDEELQGIAYLASDDFVSILDKAMTSPSFAIEDDDENNAVWMDCAVPSDVVWNSVDGVYSIVAGDGDRPVVVLMSGGEPVGYYADMGAWIDPAHRGSGLGVELVLAAARRFGRDAFVGGAGDPREGLGFSAAGLAVHERARERAEEAVAYLGGPRP